MRVIALIGDVHGNLPALEAVLQHAETNSAQAFWNIGDSVGYGPFPEQVVRLLRERVALNLQGNYDRKVLKVPEKAAKWSQTKTPEKWLAFQWAYDQLSPESREFLSKLPAQRRVNLDGMRFLLVHGSPASQNEHLFPDTPQSRMEELAELANADVVVCGHSHYAFTRRVGETLFVNTGSVGRPDDGDPRAAYALLHLDSGAVSVEHFRLDYDLERAVAEIFRLGLPADFAEMLRQGRSLDAVREDR